MTHQIDPAKLAKAREDQTKVDSILGKVFDGEQKEKPCTGESEGVKIKLATEVLRSASIISVIQTQLLLGDGSKENPRRTVVVFYLMDGTFIGEIDPVTRLPDSSIETPFQQSFQLKYNDTKPW